MNPETIKQTLRVISEALTPLADKLGTSAEYMFGLAVKQVYVNAFTAVLFLVFLGVALYGFFRFIKWGNAKEADSNYSRFDDNETFVMVAVVSGIILAILLTIGVVYFFDCVPSVINPEYKAIQNILRMVTPECK